MSNIDLTNLKKIIIDDSKVSDNVIIDSSTRINRGNECYNLDEISDYAIMNGASSKPYTFMLRNNCVYKNTCVFG